jgi:titin
MLEDRCLPAPMTFMVTTAKDNGDNVHPTAGSLRAATLAANANNGFTNTIDFKIPGNFGGFIQPPTPLPPITNPVVINGYSQTASSPNTNPSGSDNAVFQIAVDGSSAPVASNGFDIASSGAGTIIKGLAVTNWGVGIHVDASAVAITGDQIGDGNGIGISLLANGNTVGGANAAARNIISGNEDGVVVAGADLNTVEGNLFGTDSSAMSGDANATGVLVINGAMNTVGGTAPGDVNVISANLVAGVVIQGGTKNVLERNLIGTDPTGAAPLGNGSFGVVLITGTSANTIGGTSAGAANVISANGAQGVVIQGANKNLLEGNMVGTNSLGTKALGNGGFGAGVLIDNGSSGNTIGGATPGAGNLLSGQHFGVDIRGASNNRVEGNFIGTNVLGDAALPNFLDGVRIEAGSTGNIVGGAGLPLAPGLAGPTSAAGNLISGNGIGVEISDVGTTKNLVQGNLIGTNLGGDAALSNGGGVALDLGASGNTVGGLTPPSGTPEDVVGNVISGSLTDGVGMVDSTSGNLVEGNFIGTNEDGTVAVPNGLDGVLCIGTANTVGGTAAGAGNVISGNRSGVSIESGSGNLLLGNRIGCNAAGTSALPNSGDGISIEAIGGGNTVGGTAAGAGNIISGNTGDGVHIFAVTSKNILEGNLIGLTPTVTLPNDFGVVISGASANRIGGTTPAAGNVISGNANDGVLISDSGTSGNLVEGNRIGTDMSGELGAGNAQYGVVLAGANRNTVGGAVAGAGNLISGNHAGGVEIVGAADHNQVAANFIGSDKMGKVSVANLTDGVDIFGGTNNLIGGKGGFGPTGQGNLISGNDRDGVRISGETSSGNVVAGNWIGTNITGSAGLGNVGHGVFVFGGAHDNHVGSATGIGNVIAFNQQNGVVVGGSASDVGAIHNAIRFNSIFSDGSLGIDLGNNGVTLNTNPSPHVGPNRFQNFPVTVQAVATASSTTIAATLDSGPSQSFVVQFFATPVPGVLGYGEGQTLLATTMLPTNASGSGDVTLTLPQDLAGQWVSATATDTAGDTSEFSKALQVKKIAGLSTVDTLMSLVGSLPTGQPQVAAEELTRAPALAGHQAPVMPPDDEEVAAIDYPSSRSALFRGVPALRRGLPATGELDDFFLIWGGRLEGLS